MGRPHAIPRLAAAVSPRLVRLLLPLFTVVTAAFSLYQLFLFGLALRARSWHIAALYLVMGVAGLAITSSLRRASKQRGPNAER